MFLKKEPDSTEFLMLVLQRMTEGLRACKTREELIAHLKKENARPQDEHDAELQETIRLAKEDMAKLTHIY